MNLFVTCQGSFLDFFKSILLLMPADVSGIVLVSDSREFNKFQLDDIDSLRIEKEWEILSNKVTQDDLDRVKNFESNELKDSLFKAAIADRRVILGTRCKSRQDYYPRFSTDEIERRITVMAAHILKEFDENPPDLCLSFGITNLQDYLVYVICKVRSYKFLQIRGTKIENYVGLFKSLGSFEPVFKTRSDQSYLLAKSYVARIKQSTGLTYEGAIKSYGINIGRLVRNLLIGVVSDAKRLLSPTYRKDNQLEWLTYYYFRTEFLNKVVWMSQRKSFWRYKPSNGRQYFLYPMHFEPEVAIQFYGPHYLNQIELVRNIAMSLPLGARLLVKEHPRSFGYRSKDYYKALAAIPRVELVDHRLSMETLISSSQGVFSISGSTAFEAIIRGKPAWLFSETYYSHISSGICRVVTDLRRLAFEVVDLSENRSGSEVEILDLVADIIENSAPLNLYTGVLRKQNRHSSNQDDSDMTILVKKILAYASLA